MRYFGRCLGMCAKTAIMMQMAAKKTSRGVEPAGCECYFRENCGVRLFLVAVFLDVVINSSYVFVFVELVEELVEGFALFFSYFLEVVGDTDKFGALDFEAIFFEILLKLSVTFWVALSYDSVFFAVEVEFVNAEVDEFEFEFVHIDTVLSAYGEHGFAGEYEG